MNDLPVFLSEYVDVPLLLEHYIWDHIKCRMGTHLATLFVVFIVLKFLPKQHVLAL